MTNAAFVTTNSATTTFLVRAKQCSDEHEHRQRDIICFAKCLQLGSSLLAPQPWRLATQIFWVGYPGFQISDRELLRAPTQIKGTPYLQTDVLRQTQQSKTWSI